MISLFEFFYNNAIIIGIVVLSLSTTWILFRHTIKEFLFNRRLNTTQNVLRNFTTNLKEKRPSLRSIYKGFLPLLIPIIFVLAVVRNPIVYDGHINAINTSDDVKNIYENFHSKYFSTALYSTADISAQSIKTTQFEKDPEFIGDNNHVLTYHDYVLIRQDDSIEIVEYKDDYLSPRRNIEIIKDDDSIRIEGMTINNGNLIVLGRTEYNGNAENYEPYTFINVYDMDQGFDLIHEFDIYGSATQVSFNQNRLIVTTNQYLSFTQEAFDLDECLPYLVHNETKHKQSYENIKHIEGSHPNNFFTVYHLEFSTFDFAFESLLTDIESQSQIQGNSIYLINSSYEFKQISDYLELEDPVDAYKTAFTKLNVSSGSAGVHYFRTQIEKGTPIEEHAILADKQVTMAFVKIEQDDQKTIRALRFSPRLDIWHNTPMLDVPNIEDINRYENRLIVEDKEEKLYGYNLSVPSQLNILSLRGFDYPNEHVIFEGNNQKVYLSLEDDRIVIDKNVFELGEVNTHSLSLVTYRTNTLNRFFTPDDIYYRASDGRLLVPHVTTINEDEDDFNTAISVYSFEDDEFIKQYELLFPKQLHRLEPFVYRMHTRGNYIYHITPSGIAVTHSNNPSELLNYIKID